MGSEASVAIIGGGVTGASVALYLIAAGHRGSITIIEPRAEIGAGLAYDTADRAHRINVPAAKMSIYSDRPDHFTRWLETAGAVARDPQAVVGNRTFALRADFGRYVASEVAPHLASGRLRHVHGRVVEVTEAGQGWSIRTEAGERLAADIAVIATSHPAPDLPAPLLPHHANPRLIADALAPGALTAIDAADRLLIVGAGLTAMDVVASLDARGVRGQATLVSRRGLRPRGHAEGDLDPYGSFTDRSIQAASWLLRSVRAAIVEARERDIPWQAVIDAVRGQGQAIWQALPLAERRRIVRHLRPAWDVHRFRAAPQPLAIVDRKLAEGSLTHLAASLKQIEASDSGFRVVLQPRHMREIIAIDVERIIVTTGRRIRQS